MNSEKLTQKSMDAVRKAQSIAVMNSNQLILPVHLLAGLLKLIPTYWTVAVVEVIVYTPMLGAGGTYLSFVTGNIANLKLPCAINAMEGADVKANSEEGEVVSTIAIATSSIVNSILTLP